jgi:hypothetical protein
LENGKVSRAGVTYRDVETAAGRSQNVQTTVLVGLPRSGTTLLAYLLAGGKSVLSLSEPFLSKSVRRHRLLNGIYFPKIRNFRISPPAGCDEMGFLAYLKNFSFDVGYTFLIIKETYRLRPYLENTALLDRLVDGGESVVAITRHPYDTAVSTMRLFRQLRGVGGKLMRIIVSNMPATTDDREVVQWFAENWLSFAHWCKEKQLLTLRYEDLVRDPSHCLQELCEHHGIPFTGEMLNYNHPHAFYGVSGDSGVIKKDHDSLYVRPVGRQDKLKLEFRDMIRKKCSETAEELHYTL